MTFSNIHSLYEMDKGTLGQFGVKALNNELNEKTLPIGLTLNVLGQDCARLQQKSNVN